MADDKRGSPGPVPPPQRRRPAPTIDLKATEIASEPVQPAQPIDPAVDTAKNEPRSDAPPMPKAAAFDAPEQATADLTAGPVGTPPPESPPANPESAKADAPKTAASKTAPEPPPSLSPEATRTRATDVGARFGSATMIGAALAGVGATLGVFLLLWAFGAFATRDELTVTLAARLAAMETQVRDLANRPQPAGLDQRAFADLAARVGAAEQAMGRLPGLEANVSKLETSAGAPRASAPDPTLAARIATLEAALRPLADLPSRVDAVQKIAATPPPAPPPSVSPSELAALAKRVTALEQAEKAMEQRIVARPAPANGADQPGRAAFVAITLRSAVERGDPFASELAAAKSLASDAATLAPLEPFAASGLPRPAALVREFSQVASAMLTASMPRDASLMDRLQQSAEKLVRIRPVNESAAGDDPAAIVGRAEAKITRGDIAGALAEIARLPEGTRAPAQAWVRKAEMQVAALNAAQRFADNAVGALAGGKQ